MIRYVLVLTMLAPVVHADVLADDASVREMFWQLLSQSRFGFSHQEEAAFVVRGGDGYQCVAWMADGFVDSARWEGRIPDGVIAIIHTHPNWMPSPSKIDAQTSRTSHVPVYVITRAQITMTSGDTSQVVVAGDWKPANGARPCSPVGAALAQRSVRSGRDGNSYSPLLRITSE